MSSRSVAFLISLTVLAALVIGFCSGVAWTQRKWDNAIQTQKTVDEKESIRRDNEQRRISKNAEAAASAAKLDADVARDHAERLQQSFAQQRGLNTCSEQSRSATDEAWNLRSDVFGSVVNRVTKLAEYADAARIAGDACQQQYNSLGEYHAQ